MSPWSWNNERRDGGGLPTRLPAVCRGPAIRPSRHGGMEHGPRRKSSGASVAFDAVSSAGYRQGRRLRLQARFPMVSIVLPYPNPPQRIPGRKPGPVHGMRAPDDAVGQKHSTRRRRSRDAHRDERRGGFLGPARQPPALEPAAGPVQRARRKPVRRVQPPDFGKVRFPTAADPGRDVLAGGPRYALSRPYSPRRRQCDGSQPSSSMTPSACKVLGGSLLLTHVTMISPPPGSTRTVFFFFSTSTIVSSGSF